MNTDIQTYQKQPGNIRGLTLIAIAFATAFFPRLLSTAGAPVPINFVHFAVVPLVCGFVLAQTKVKDKQQIKTAKVLLSGLAILFGVTAASALLNGAGIINVFLDFLLLTEPFILLLSIVCIPVSYKEHKRFKNWALGFGFANLFLALAQKFLLTVNILRLTRLTIEDNVQGVFYLSNGGHVVAATVTLCFCLYYLLKSKSSPFWLRVSVVFAGLLQILFADAKQVLMVALVAWLILILCRVENIKVTIQYLIAAFLAGYAFYWCIQNLEIFRAYNTWIRPEIYGPDGDATILKTAPFHIIPTYFESPLNWLLGLGPGHTIGRLGGWMIRDYWSLLGPLKATSHPVVNVIWDTWLSSYLDSSFFSPFWGWVGIWGDLGFLGLAAFLYIWLIVWTRLCPDDFSRFIVLNVLVNGFIFTLMEEPGFMLFVAVLIGLQWQERQLAQQQRQQERQVAYYMANLNSLEL
jgi:hypothetical protein